MSTLERTSIWGAIGELSALSAGIFALSFIYGFNEYKSFIEAAGVGWGGAFLSPSTYAMRSVKAFMQIAPYTVLAFGALKYSLPDRAVRFLFILSFAVGILYMLIALWLIRYGYAARATPSALGVLGWSPFGRLLLGIYVAVVIVGVGEGLLNKAWHVIGSILCLYVFLVVFPKITGEAQGVLVETSHGATLPYIEEAGGRWFIADYQIGSSLLVRYEEGKPLVMYKAIEGAVIKYDHARKYTNEWDKKR